ncbi:hypothetical protein SAMN05216359_10194 [Roseateles sp. YR242]|nr:hypothetical protein [Roseateles sp. YR242]SEK22931.1 hypothetical protein SAMN05216359_10194 [Roseateles sp. YR242]
MSKRQHGNKEAKKPKQAKPPEPTPAMPGPATPPVTSSRVGRR